MCSALSLTGDPDGPMSPFSPLRPGYPMTPTSPLGPSEPGGPAGPGSPGFPRGPWNYMHQTENEKKTIRTSNSFPHLYLNRIWTNWTCCRFFPFHFSTTNFNFLQGAMWSCSVLGLHWNFILANVSVVLLWYCYCIVFTTLIITLSPSSPGAPGRPTSPWGNTETELSSNWTLFRMPLCWPVTTGQHLIPAGLL